MKFCYISDSIGQLQCLESHALASAPRALGLTLTLATNDTAIEYSQL